MNRIPFTVLLPVSLVLLSCTHAKPTPHPARIPDSLPLAIEVPSLELPQSLQLAPPQQNAVFKLLVKTNGKPVDIQLTHSSGNPDVDALCRSNLEHSRFRPGYSGGVAVPMTTTITFRLAPP